MCAISMPKDRGKTMKRYEKNLGLIGIEGQKILNSSHIAIIGAGGLGGTVFEIMLRYGVGHIKIIDFDSFEETNLNRQILSSVAGIGEKKVDAAKNRGELVNPETKIEAICEKISDTNAKNILSGCDVAIDCLGNIKDRFVLERAAKTLGIPFVHAAVAGHTGQITSIFPEDTGLSAIYGDEKSAPKSGEEVSVGTPPSTVMTIASMQAHEAIIILTGIQEPLRNKLLRIDLKNWKTSILTIHTDS